jgi:CMP-N-acetylneuraminic acid synthetase
MIAGSNEQLQAYVFSRVEPGKVDDVVVISDEEEAAEGVKPVAPTPRRPTKVSQGRSSKQQSVNNCLEMLPDTWAC